MIFLWSRSLTKITLHVTPPTKKKVMHHQFLLCLDLARFPGGRSLAAVTSSSSSSSPHTASKEHDLNNLLSCCLTAPPEVVIQPQQHHSASLHFTTRKNLGVRRLRETQTHSLAHRVSSTHRSLEVFAKLWVHCRFTQGQSELWGDSVRPNARRFQRSAASKPSLQSVLQVLQRLAGIPNELNTYFSLLVSHVKQSHINSLSLLMQPRWEKARTLQQGVSFARSRKISRRRQN